MTATNANKQYDLNRSIYYVGKIPTKYFTVSPIDVNRSIDKRIIIIPGNPGICDYYLTFAIALFQATGARWTIECIDHAGHSGLEPNIYILQQQIQHKIDYITQWIPKSTNLILIGHSIGAHIAIEVMKSLPDARITRSFLLFPTIERMAISPNGIRLAPKFASKFHRTALASVCFLASLLPNSILERLVRWYHYSEASDRGDPYCIQATSRLLNKDVVLNCLNMANTEMQEVVNLDVDGIKTNLDRLYFYYGQTDDWVPLTYYKELKDKFPQGQIILDSNNTPHAFVVKSSQLIADKVAKEIQNLW